MHSAHCLPNGLCYVAVCPLVFDGVAASVQLRLDHDFLQVVVTPALTTATFLHLSVSCRPFVALPVRPVMCSWLHFFSESPSEPFAIVLS